MIVLWVHFPGAQWVAIQKWHFSLLISLLIIFRPLSRFNNTNEYDSLLLLIAGESNGSQPDQVVSKETPTQQGVLIIWRYATVAHC